MVDVNPIPSEIDRASIVDAFDSNVINAVHLDNTIYRTVSGDVFARYRWIGGYDPIVIGGIEEHDIATETESSKEICDEYHVSFDELERIATLEQIEACRELMENNRLFENTMQQAVLMVGAGAEGLMLHLSCKEYSWRGKGVLSKAEDQGVDPICWVISGTEILEAVNLIEHKEPVHLSKQQLLDGCASETLAYDFPLHCLFDWIIRNGLASAFKYPWTGKKGSLKKMEPEFTLEEYEILSICDEDGIKRRLYQRPLCIVIRVSVQLRSLKKGKIYHVTKQEYDPYVASCMRLRRPIMYHSLVLTGWNEIGGLPVWEALNSYGDKYCDDGYFYFVRGSAINEDLEYNPLVQVLDVKGFKKAEK